MAVHVAYDELGKMAKDVHICQKLQLLLQTVVLAGHTATHPLFEPPNLGPTRRDCGCIGKFNSIAGWQAHKSCTLLHPQYAMHSHKAMAALLPGRPF